MEGHYFTEPDYVAKYEADYVDAVNAFMKDRSKTNMNTLYSFASNNARSGRKSWQAKIWGGNEPVIIVENEEFEIDDKKFLTVGFMVSKNIPVNWFSSFARDLNAEVYWYGFNAYRSDYGSIKPDGNDLTIRFNLRSDLMDILKAIYPDQVPEADEVKLGTSELQTLALSVHKLADDFTTRLGGISGSGSDKDLDKALKEYKTIPFDTGKDFHAFIKTLDYFLNEISYLNQAKKFIEASKTILANVEKKLNETYKQRTFAYATQTRKKWENAALVKGISFTRPVDAVNLLLDLFEGDYITACAVWSILAKLDENENVYMQLLQGVTALFNHTDLRNVITENKMGAFFSYLKHFRGEQSESLDLEDYLETELTNNERRIINLIKAGISGEVALHQITENYKSSKLDKVRKSLDEIDRSFAEDKKVADAYIDKAEEFALTKDVTLEGETDQERQKSALDLLVRCNNGLTEYPSQFIEILTTKEKGDTDWDWAYYCSLTTMQESKSVAPATLGEIGSFYLWLNGVMHDRAETKKKVQSVMDSIPDSQWNKLEEATKNLLDEHSAEIKKAEKRGFSDALKEVKELSLEVNRVERLIKLAKEEARHNEFSIKSSDEATNLLKEIYGEEGLANRVMADLLSKELPDIDRIKLRIEIADMFLTESPDDQDPLGAFFEYIDKLGG